MKKARQVEAPPMDTDDEDEEGEAEQGQSSSKGVGGESQNNNNRGSEAEGTRAGEGAGGGDCDYITLEIEGGDQMLHDGKGQYSIIGLDTDTPYLQLAGKTYQGSFEYVMGTHMYFEDDDTDVPDDSSPLVQSRYYAMSTKKIVFRPVVLVPKDAPANPLASE